MHETLALETLYDDQFTFINSVDKNKLPYCNPTDAAPQFLWRFTPSIHLFSVGLKYIKVKIPSKQGQAATTN